MDQLWREASVWLVLAVLARLISLKICISVALVELAVGLASFAFPFVTDLGTVVALGLLFSRFDLWFWIFVATLVVALVFLPRVTAPYLRAVNAHISEPEVKYLFLVLLLLAFLDAKGGSEGVLPWSKPGSRSSGTSGGTWKRP